VMLYQRSEGGVSGRPVFDASAPVIAEFRKVPAFSF
jgi:protein-L-isoaspartate(D-aspartate) O-methyltransferase